MSLLDTDLEEYLLRELTKVEEIIDYIGPTSLRHKLNELIVEARETLRTFDQAEFERGRSGFKE